jgi:hypothetical protein
MVEELNVGVAHGGFDYTEEVSYDSLAAVLHVTPLHVIKVHDYVAEIVELVHRGRGKITYIHRDIRDVAVSLRRRRLFALPAIVRRFDVIIATYCSLRDTVDPELMLTQKYRDVATDIPSAARELAQFLGLAASEDLIAQVAEECSLENARAITRGLRQKLDDKLRQLGPNSAEGRELRRQVRAKKHTNMNIEWILNYDHISRDGGTSGVWKTQLNAHEQDVLTERYRWWLVETGYISD